MPKRAQPALLACAIVMLCAGQVQAASSHHHHARHHGRVHVGDYGRGEEGVRLSGICNRARIAVRC